MFLDLPIDDAINSHFDSVTPVSTAVADNLFFARISMLAELPRMEDLRSLSNSKCLSDPHGLVCLTRGSQSTEEVIQDSQSHRRRVNPS